MIIAIDHLLTFVTSLDAAAQTYRRLGFTLTPASDITAMGIANRLVTFRPRTPGAASFIELMAVTEASRLPPPMKRLLSGDEGGKSMVLATSDAAMTQRALNKLGHPFAPPVHVRREWTLSPTESVYPEFDVLLPLDAPLPFNACQYRDAGVYVREAWLQHANTARHLDALIAVADDVESMRAQVSDVFNAPTTRDEAGAFAVTMGGTKLSVYNRDAFAARYGHVPSRPGYQAVRLLVDDMAACRMCLVAAQVPFGELRTGDFVVPPAANHGVGLVFGSSS
jgi:hypothetical protein